MTYVLRNSHFSNKETAFSGPWVVWSLFGAPGEKKRQNQMFLQDLHSFAPLESQVEKNTMKNHLENPDEQASSKQSPGEQYRAGKQTSDKDY